MSAHLDQELVTYLEQARDLEQLDCHLLDAGVRGARDERVREIYRAHHRETKDHLRLIEECLYDRSGAVPGASGDGVVGVLALHMAAEASHTPTRLAISAFAFEGLEIAIYHLLTRLAERCRDGAAARLVQDILAEEERAAEFLAGTLDRAILASLGVAANGGRSD